MGVALLAAVFWLPPTGVLLVLLLVCGLGTWEFYGLLDAGKIAHFKIVGLVGGLLLVGATWVTLRSSAGQSATGEWAVLFLVTIVVVIRQLPQKHNTRPIETMAVTLLGVLYVPYLFNFFTKLLVGWENGEGRLLILYMIMVVKCNDIGAYFVGCSMGHHKLLARISPAKSWEGSVGGVLSGVAASVLYYVVSRGDLGVVQLHMFDALMLGFLLPVCGITGDLCESMLKRASGVKDSGRLILGMGGVLDLIDSLLFAAPALYVYTYFFVNG